MGAVPWIVSPPDGGAADLAAALGVRPLIAALLRRRGISTVAEARRFLDPRLEDLADPRSLPGMDRAVERVAQALRAGSRIAVHGDYDVDGVSATAILLRGLRALGAEPLWHLPHRFHDGYGLGSRAVETFGAHGAALLIAADCGITNQSTSPVSASMISPFNPRIMRGCLASLSCCGDVGYVLFLSRKLLMALAYCCMA